ncbi:MAG: hypothetical protein ACI3W8_03485 [Oscillospiraceae bacterium]
MKHKIAGFLAMMMLFSLTACSAQQTNAAGNSPSDEITDNNADANTAGEIASSELSGDVAIRAAGYELISAGGEFGSTDFSQYYLHDMDDDGTAEIIVLGGTCEADAVLLVYTYVNGVYEQAGSTDGSHCSLCGNSKDGGLTVHHGIQGVESIDWLILENRELVEEEIIAPHEVQDYTEFDYCIPLTAYSINDHSIFGETNGTGEKEVSE